MGMAIKDLKKMKLTLLIPPSKFDLVILEKSSCIYCPNEEAYIVPEGIKFETINSLKNEIDYYRKLSEHRLKGLHYWKDKNSGTAMD